MDWLGILLLVIGLSAGGLWLFTPQQYSDVWYWEPLPFADRLLAALCFFALGALAGTLACQSVLSL